MRLLTSSRNFILRRYASSTCLRSSICAATRCSHPKRLIIRTAFIPVHPCQHAHDECHLRSNALSLMSCTRASVWGVGYSEFLTLSADDVLHSYLPQHLNLITLDPTAEVPRNREHCENRTEANQCARVIVSIVRAGTSVHENARRTYLHPRMLYMKTIEERISTGTLTTTYVRTTP